MFTDIVGYTALMDHDEQRAFAVLNSNRQLQRPIIEKHNGQWLKEIGDGVLASFDTITDAVMAAGEIQDSSQHIADLQLRIGIHLGEVIFEGDDVFGSGVNIASRIESLAPPGGILVSESVHKNVINKRGITTTLVKEEQLKGVREHVRIYQLELDKAQVADTRPHAEGVVQPKIKQRLAEPRRLLLVAASLLLLALGYLGISKVGAGSKATSTLETKNKSIAVLPFVSLSDDPEKQYLADGVMDAILLHLSKIENLRVITRTSVERYRNTKMSIPQIAAELNVDHILEGSFQKQGDHANLIVQLSNAEKDEDHLWADEYPRDWSDIFAVQSEVAQTIASKLRAVITPAEKQLIEKKPTTSLTAYDFYQRGRSEHVKYLLDNQQKDALEKAAQLYHNALEYDSTFALAYTGLAHVFWNKHYWDALISENLMDSIIELVNTALSFDDQLAQAYVIRGNYFRFNNNNEQAVIEYDKAIKYNPSSGEAYWRKAILYEHDDLLKSIYYFQKAASLYRGARLPQIYRRFGRSFAIAGFKDEAIHYTEEALKLDNDSALYYAALSEIEDGAGNPKESIELGEKSFSMDSTNAWIAYLLGIQHMFLGQNEEYLRYMQKHHALVSDLDNPSPFTVFRIGHAYWVNGNKSEAEIYFDRGTKFYTEMIGLGRHFYHDMHTYYNLAAISSFIGNREKAYEYLRLLNQRPRMPRWMIKDIKNDPLFKNLRDDPEFEQIVDDVVEKYEAEHERVGVWLEEEGLH